MQTINKIAAAVLGITLSASALAQVPTTSNDPALTNTLNDVLKGMQHQRDGSERKMNVFVLSTGALVNDDVSYFGGKNYIELDGADELQKDGVTTRDENDYEDYFYDGASLCVSGNGLAMASVIGAKQSNAIGIDGVVNSSIYMARVAYSECAGANEWPVAKTSAVVEALKDASDAFSAIEGAETDIVSIGVSIDSSTCRTDLGEEITDLVESGVTVIVPAQSGIAECNGVIAVGAHTASGASMYSHNGADVAALGQRDVAIEGTTTPSQKEGLHLAVSAVSGMVGVIKQQMPTLTPSKFKDSFERTAKNVSCSDCGEGAANLLSGLQFAEKLYAPFFQFTSAINDTNENCLSEREFEALSQHMDVCNIILGQIDAPYAEDGVDYHFKVVKRAISSSPWEITSSESLFDYSPSMDHDALPIVDDGTAQFEYGISACAELPSGEWYCPEVWSIDPAGNNGYVNSLPAACR